MGFKHGCAKDPQGVCSKCSFPGSDPDSKSELLFESGTVKYAPHGISKHRLWEPYLEKHCPVLQTRKQAWYGERTWHIKHNWLLAAKSPALVSYSQAQLYSARFPASASLLGANSLKAPLTWEAASTGSQEWVPDWRGEFVGAFSLLSLQCPQTVISGQKTTT